LDTIVHKFTIPTLFIIHFSLLINFKWLEQKKKGISNVHRSVISSVPCSANEARKSLSYDSTNTKPSDCPIMKNWRW